MNRMELLAPAGDRDALVAAVQNGADAVYLGTGAFNARRNAANFDGAALDEAVSYCHARGVKVHVTLNTLVTQNELDALEEAVRRIALSGADAVIVQDFGVARAVRRIAPDLALHASTQMAAHNPQAVRFLAENGFDRAVLARELTWAEIAACAACGIEIETFIHGALCVACSGQCLMSSLVGGRSGNRGLCAQPCRLPWRLDGHEGYLLSTKDLCALDDLARLRDAGVTSLKIEGRMKRAEYVAVTVAAYRRALDALEAGRGNPDAVADRAALAQMFNRGGFTRGYGPGVEDADLMFADRPNHLGVPVGNCRRTGEITLDADVEADDTLALRRDGDAPEKHLPADMAARENEDVPVRLSGRAGERIRCPEARRGDALIRLVSAAQMRAARETLGRESRTIPVSLRAEFHVGAPARLMAELGAKERARSSGETGGTARPASGETVARREAVWDAPVERATGRPFDRERAAAQLKKTGGTPFVIESIEIDADDDAFVPVSTLNGLRRRALEGEDVGAARRDRLNPMPRVEIPRAETGRPRLLAQAADAELLRRALQNGADGAVFAPLDVREETLAALDLSEFAGRLSLAVPAVLDGAALDALNRWAMARASWFGATYLSNIGQLGLAWPGRRIGDYMLNAGNDLTVAQLIDWGMDAYTPSVELNAGQLRRMGGARELVMWGRVPLMHLRHCPLRAAEGMRGAHADCRRCDGCAAGQRVDDKALVDRKGAAFPLQRLATDGGCVIQALNSAQLMPLRKLGRIPDAAAWRLLLRADEPVEAVIRVYRAALDGADFRSLPEWASLDALNTTTGHFFRGVE